MRRFRFFYQGILAAALGSVVPLVASAEHTTSHFISDSDRTLRGLIFIVTDLAQAAIPVLVGLALLLFFWGLAQFILQSDNEQKRAESKRILWIGVIVLFIILSLGGILQLLSVTFLS